MSLGTAKGSSTGESHGRFASTGSVASPGMGIDELGGLWGRSEMGIGGLLDSLASASEGISNLPISQRAARRAARSRIDPGSAW